MENNIFIEVSVLISLCAAIAMVMRFLRQPLIIGYIITGLLVGPSLLGLVHSPDTIEVFGNFGVTLLLFIVGLGLNLQVIKDVGKASVLVGFGQVSLTALLGYWIAGALGYNSTTAIYIAIGLAFSSTIIILKLLSDNKEHNKLHGKISIGILLIQDLLATVALVVTSAAANGGVSYQSFMPLAAKGIALFACVFLVAHFLVRPMTNFLGRSQELLFLFAIAWGFGIAAIFFEVGFSVEVGALLAGAALATMPYAQEIGSRLRPLRDFFIIVFFIALGTRLNVNDVQTVIGPALILSAFVLIGKPLIIMTVMGLLGYTKKTSFKTSMALAQISEFSLILILLAANNNLVDKEIVSLLMVVAVITIAVSSYMITYSDQLFEFFERYLRLFERKKIKPERNRRTRVDAILFGFKRGGNEYAHVFKQLSKKFLVVDYDPDSIDDIERHNIPYMYGDATDLQLLEEINLDQVKLVVSVVTDHSTNVFLLHYIGQHNPHCVVICHADSVQEAVELYGLGASFVVLPHYIGNEKVSGFIKKNGFKKSEFKKYKEKHLEYLKNHFESEDDN